MAISLTLLITSYFGFDYVIMISYLTTPTMTPITALDITIENHSINTPMPGILKENFPVEQSTLYSFTEQVTGVQFN